ncbi:MAG: ABC transporter permease [Phycisphaerae bacterium]|nr:ABC transporter permease [Phycisphaerae bacterium]
MRSLRIILYLAGKQLRILSRMRAVLAVVFLPGIVLYSVFTLIFAGPAGRPFRVAVVDLDGTRESRQLIDMLAANNVVVIQTENEEPNGPPLTVESARHLIRDKGKFRVALVIPKGYSKAPNVLSGDAHEGVELHFDETQQMEANVVAGMIQMAAGRALFARFENLRALGNTASNPTEQAKPDDGPSTLVKIQRHGLAPNRMQIAAKHTFLAGIVPMFLLFGSTGAARGLLEELQSGEVRRLLAAPILPAHILLGQMLSAFVLAMVQCYVMYVYAWLVFGVAVWSIAGGLFVLTVVSCLATTGFGMFMASLCRTSEQLDGIGTTVILAMSAIGGSMVPRFVMPSWMQPIGLFTINGWSYDGFIALIRNEGFGLDALVHHDGIRGIWLPCLVLLFVATACATAGSLILARRLRAGPSN